MQLVHSAGQPIQRDRLLARPEVKKTVGFGDSTMYALIRAGKFPPGIRISHRCVRWSEVAVLSWVQDRIKSASGQSNGGDL